MEGNDLTQGYIELGADLNKVNKDSIDAADGVTGNPVPELELSMTDDEIVRLTTKWENKYATYSGDVKQRSEESERYWLGKQYHNVEYNDRQRPLTDNLIFEALETFLPEAGKQNPEPIVMSDNTPEGNKLSNDIRGMLVFQADRQCLKLKLKKLTRYWSLYFLGVAKIGWSVDCDDIETSILRPQKLVLDSDATIGEDGVYTGEYIGEYKTMAASSLIEVFPKKKSYIENLVQNEMGTKVTYIEWWTNDKLFFTLKREVLGKMKNPHWNYDGEETRTNDYGYPVQVPVRGRNHFPYPKMPYVFLSVFNLGKHPHDDTSLVRQNLANQDMINKRLRQINKNADNMNNGIVLSGDSFTKEQAAQASDALSNGDALWVPEGDIGRAYRRDQAPGLPNDVFNQLMDMRNELRNIFGVRGSTAQGIASQDTVRGKILSKESDSSRIGGGVTEYLEQVADTIFNWWVQMFYVYYTEPHSASILGAAKSQEMIAIHTADLNRKLTISVKEGSLIPKDSLTQRNEAIDLWSAGALDPITLFEKLDFPDPKRSAELLFMWKTSPQLLFPDMQQPPQMTPEPTSAPPPSDITQPPSDNLLSNVPIQ